MPPGSNDVKGYLLGTLTKMEQASDEFLTNAIAYQKLVDTNSGDVVKAFAQSPDEVMRLVAALLRQGAEYLSDEFGPFGIPKSSLISDW